MSKGFPMLPQAARAIERLRAAGHEAWIVGGCVRDVLLGRTPTDYDLTTSALPEETEAVFAGEKLIETGLQHGTVTVLLEGVPLEITTYRVDGGYTDARHPDGVTFTRSLREDAARRDFTINAMAYAPGEGLQDFFGGQADLSAGVIRAVGRRIGGFRRTPCASCGRSGLLRCWGSSWTRRRTPPPGEMRRCSKKFRSSGCLWS